jgi:DNA-directed RNA polymerase specialized sigma24 family protein
MEKGLSAQAFGKLLDHLADDRAQAGEKYEELRRILLRFFEWRGGAFPDELTDETFNRVAEKLNAGVEIRNMGAYCHEVGRFVYLESLRSHDKNRLVDDTAVTIVAVVTAIARTAAPSLPL